MMLITDKDLSELRQIDQKSSWQNDLPELKFPSKDNEYAESNIEVAKFGNFL